MTKKNEKQNRKDYSVPSQNALNPNSNQNLQEQLEHYKKMVSSLTGKIAGMDKLVTAHVETAFLLSRKNYNIKNVKLREQLVLKLRIPAFLPVSGSTIFQDISENTIGAEQEYDTNEKDEGKLWLERSNSVYPKG